MADLAVSAVTILRAWNEAGPAGRDLSCRRVTLSLTSQGSTTNKISASVLQLSFIEQSSNFISASNTGIYPTSPSVDGTMLLIANLADATDATRPAPTDLGGPLVVTGIVKG